MKIAIMQPYFIPYIGYFQLINSVDKFVVYDEIEYTKKGWINRNRILVNCKPDYLSLPLKKESDYLNVNQRYLSQSFQKDKIKIERKIKECYSKAPFFLEGQNLMNKILEFNDFNLFNFIWNSIEIICKYLNIKTELIKSSSIDFDLTCKGERKVISICKALRGLEYINPIGGIELYDSKNFLENRLNLLFLKSNLVEYNQFENKFVSWLSIIDVIMFNSKDKIEEQILKEYKLTSI